MSLLFALGVVTAIFVVALILALYISVRYALSFDLAPDAKEVWECKRCGAVLIYGEGSEEFKCPMAQFVPPGVACPMELKSS